MCALHPIDDADHKTAQDSPHHQLNLWLPQSSNLVSSMSALVTAQRRAPAQTRQSQEEEAHPQFAGVPASDRLSDHDSSAFPEGQR